MGTASALAMGLTMPDAAVGESAWRIRFGFRAVRDLPRWSSLDLADSERIAHRGVIAQDRSREEGPRVDLSGRGILSGQRCQSVRVEIARLHLFLSLQPVFDGPH